MYANSDVARKYREPFQVLCASGAIHQDPPYRDTPNWAVECPVEPFAIPHPKGQCGQNTRNQCPQKSRIFSILWCLFFRYCSLQMTPTATAVGVHLLPAMGGCPPSPMAVASASETRNVVEGGGRPLNKL